MSLLKNPMILLGIVAMGLMFGMPKLMENSMLPISMTGISVANMMQWILRCARNLRNSKELRD